MVECYRHSVTKRSSNVNDLKSDNNETINVQYMFKLQAQRFDRALTSCIKVNIAKKRTKQTNTHTSNKTILIYILL